MDWAAPSSSAPPALHPCAPIQHGAAGRCWLEMGGRITPHPCCTPMQRSISGPLSLLLRCLTDMERGGDPGGMSSTTALALAEKAHGPAGLSPLAEERAQLWCFTGNLASGFTSVQVVKWVLDKSRCFARENKQEALPGLALMRFSPFNFRIMSLLTLKIPMSLSATAKPR